MSNSLLEQMKVEAKMVTEIQQSELLRNERHAKAVQSVIGPVLGKIHQYLTEFRQYASVLDKDIMVDFVIQEVGFCQGLVQKSYRLSSGEDPLNSVVFSAELSSAQPIKIGMEYRGKVKPLLDQLRKAGLIINKHNISHPETPKQVVLLDIEPNIPMRMEFKSTEDLKTVKLILSNYDELGTREYTIQADDLTDEMLNELGKFILHKENKFLTEGVSWVSSKGAHEKPGQEFEEKRGLAETAEIMVGKLRSLFNTKKVGYTVFSIKDEEIEISNTRLPCVLGRKGTDGLVVDSQHVSRKHASIINENGKVFVCDHSNNGTFIQQEGKEVIKLKGEQIELTGRGKMSLGVPIRDTNPDIIFYSCDT